MKKKRLCAAVCLLLCALLLTGCTAQTAADARAAAQKAAAELRSALDETVWLLQDMKDEFAAQLREVFDEAAAYLREAAAERAAGQGDPPQDAPLQTPSAEQSAPDAESGGAGAAAFGTEAGTGAGTEETGVHPLSRLHYDRLDETQKLLYRQMYAIVSVFAPAGPLSPAPKEALDAAFLALCADRPELFWLTGYSGSYTSRSGEIVAVEFRPGYSVTAEEQQRLAAVLEAARDRILYGMAAALPADAPDADRALYLFDHIAQSTRYDEAAPHSQSLISCLVEGRAVCAGYARALQYLLLAADIPCSLVNGTANGVAHAWVLAQLDGSSYHMDPTWGDSDLAGADGRELLHWEYFAMNDAQLALTHTPDAAGLPPCTGEAASLFVRRGTRMAQWDTVALENLLRTAAAGRAPDLCLEFTGADAWAAAKSAPADGTLHRLLSAAAAANPALRTDTLQYFMNEERQVLHLVFSYGE